MSTEGIFKAHPHPQTQTGPPNTCMRLIFVDGVRRLIFVDGVRRLIFVDGARLLIFC